MSNEHIKRRETEKLFKMRTGIQTMRTNDKCT